MELLKSKEEIRASVAGRRAKGLTIGLVPSMGAFHGGHISLIEASAADFGCTVVSIFVNPTQFAPDEDFEHYPRDLNRDLRAAKEAGAELVYAPSVDAVYQDSFVTYIQVENLGEVLCGASRPGHFRGVLTVVAKLLNTVRPDALYLGRKDAQQAIVLKQMVRDLDFDVEVRVMPTVREPDGFAMSSRNKYLSPAQRAIAPKLFESLCLAGRLLESGETDAQKLVARALDFLADHQGIEVEYLEARRVEDLELAPRLEDKTLLALAARIGDTRLIDNIILNPRKGSFEV